MVDDDIYDLTKFQEEHPGGQKSETVADVSKEMSTNL